MLLSGPMEISPVKFKSQGGARARDCLLFLYPPSDKKEEAQARFKTWWTWIFTYPPFHKLDEFHTGVRLIVVYLNFDGDDFHDDFHEVE